MNSGYPDFGQNILLTNWSMEHKLQVMKIVNVETKGIVSKSNVVDKMVTIFGTIQNTRIKIMKSDGTHDYLTDTIRINLPMQQRNARYYQPEKIKIDDVVLYNNIKHKIYSIDNKIHTKHIVFYAKIIPS